MIEEPKMPESPPIEPATRSLVEQDLQPFVENLVDDLAKFPRGYDATSLGGDEIVKAIVDFTVSAALLMHQVAGTRDVLPGKLSELFEALTDLDDYDVAKVAFSPATRLLPPATLALLTAANRRISIDRLTFVVEPARVPDARATSPGVWQGQTGAGASRNALALVAEGSVARGAGRDTFALPIASRLLHPIGNETDGAMFARLGSEMLDDVAEASELLEGLGRRGAAGVLRRLHLALDAVSYGPPSRKGRDRRYLTSLTYELGRSWPLTATLAGRGRPFVAQITDFFDEPADGAGRSELRYRSSEQAVLGEDELRKRAVALFDAAPNSPAQAAAAARLGARRLRQQDLDAQGITGEWWALVGTGLLVGDAASGAEPMQVRVLLRRRHALTQLFVLRARRGELVPMLRSAERRFHMDVAKVLDLCVERYFRRAGDHLRLRGNVAAGLRAGVVACTQTANLVYVLRSKLG